MTDPWWYHTFKNQKTNKWMFSNSRSSCVTFSHSLLLLEPNKLHWDELIFQHQEFFQELPLKILSHFHRWNELLLSSLNKLFFLPWFLIFFPTCVEIIFRHVQKWFQFRVTSEQKTLVQFCSLLVVVSQEIPGNNYCNKSKKKKKKGS